MKRHYNREALTAIMKDRGYVNLDALSIRLSEYYDLKPKTIAGRINGGRFTREETIVIASVLEMTAREYAEVFLCGVFSLTNSGKIIAKVKHPHQLLHPSKQEGEIE